jgi:hypothetical protein
LRLKSERLQLRYGPLRSDGPFRSLHLVGRCGHRTRLSVAAKHERRSVSQCPEIIGRWGAQQEGDLSMVPRGVKYYKHWL